MYFDQNAWQCAINKFSASEFKQKLETKQIEICLGMHNIYEFARCFLDENNSTNIKEGKKIFKYLKDLDITFFVKLTDELIDSDLVYARTGGKILPYLDQYNAVAAKAEIYRLAIGKCDGAKEFIQNREKSLAKNWSKYRASVTKTNVNVSRPKDFVTLQNDWKYRRDVLDQSEFAKTARYISDSTLFSKPKKYPYLNTYINAQLYLTYIAIKTPNGPSKKSTSDYKHLINANAADCLVTNDKKVTRNSQKLCQYFKVNSWDEFEMYIAN